MVRSIKDIRNKLNRFLNSYDGIFFDVIYFFRDMMTNYIVFKRQVRNFFFWGWKLRDDVNWDYSSLLNTLNIKLKLIYDYFSKTEISGMKNKDDDWHSHYKALRICCKISDRLQNDYYSKYHDIIEKKFGKCEMKFDKIEGTEYSELKIEYALQTEENSDYIHNTTREYYNLYENMKQRDIRIMFKLISVHLEYWWD